MPDHGQRTSETRRAAAANGREPYLRIENLTKMFGSFTALENINLEVREGEFVCFLGPSGCGKTTLLRCIAGLDIQTYGRVIQDGRDISTLPPDKRDFGIVFQSYALFPNLTVHKNLAYGLENRRMKRAEIDRRVTELLELVGLQGQGPKYPAQLSGGQQQRVALARALATWPGLLLLDEPLSALDARVRVHLRHEVRALQRRLAITTIMVTHDQEEALTMADRIVVMDQGTIVQVGSAVDIYRDPASPFVADFVGTMNFLPGVARGERRLGLGRIELECGNGLDGLAQGTPVTVCVRPEDLLLGTSDSRAPNRVPAKVRYLEFLGAFYRATLVVEGLEDQPLRVDFSPTVQRDLGIREDEPVTVFFPDDRMHVFDRPPAERAAGSEPN
ncbi:MAG TPA: putative 2-aminoethylphosphonate ABC transporter ATP-binding protein [Kiloniellales bacterium]|nr:putative 2-aminoethylphosphonate ABC transporter ATP-binding protein [Kiloniellales bacterium]